MRKIILSTIAATIAASGLSAAEIKNIYQFSPKNYERHTGTYSLNYAGKDGADDTKLSAGLLDYKISLMGNYNTEIFITGLAEFGYLTKSKGALGVLGTSVGYSSKVTESTFLTVLGSYKYNYLSKQSIVNGDSWHQVGVGVMYGWQATDSIAIGVSGFYDKTKSKLKKDEDDSKGTLYGAGIPVSYSIDKNKAITLYVGTESYKIDEYKKTRPVASIGFSMTF